MSSGSRQSRPAAEEEPDWRDTYEKQLCTEDLRDHCLHLAGRYSGSQTIQIGRRSMAGIRGFEVVLIDDEVHAKAIVEGKPWPCPPRVHHIDAATSCQLIQIIGPSRSIASGRLVHRKLIGDLTNAAVEIGIECCNITWAPLTFAGRFGFVCSGPCGGELVYD